MPFYSEKPLQGEWEDVEESGGYSFIGLANFILQLLQLEHLLGATSTVDDKKDRSCTLLGSYI